jgi:hypothetical protein
VETTGKNMKTKEIKFLKAINKYITQQTNGFNKPYQTD